MILKESKAETLKITNLKNRTSFLSIHGNITYDFFYRSNMDTPVRQKDFRQHTESVDLSILIKKKYPFKIRLISRQNNSPFFKSPFDVQLNFDRYAYTTKLKQNLLDKIRRDTSGLKLPDLINAQDAVRKAQADYDKLKNWLESPLTLQRIIEEKERKYYQQYQSNSDSIRSKNDIRTFFSRAESPFLKFRNRKNDAVLIPSDSLNKEIEDRTDKIPSYESYYARQKAGLDSLRIKVETSKTRLGIIRSNVETTKIKVQQSVYQATSARDLKKLADKNSIALDKNSSLENHLAAIKSFSIGRSTLDYTELTAQNIIVSGINIEYNPSYYAAFAAGKINYQFRDFFRQRRQNNNGQFIVLGRLGVGEKDRKGVIFSYYTGRKTSGSLAVSDTTTKHVNLTGYSIEAFIKKNESSFLSAEVAKSTRPISSVVHGSDAKGLFQFRDQSNMGINLKAQTIIRETHTKLSGFYRKTGQNFQSFSVFTYNTNQTAWQVRMDQSFFKERIVLSSMLRRNDFSNPFADRTYQTNTVFKSFMANIRFPKYPTLSVGYYPGTQLFMVDKNTIQESAYYILNGSINYSYLMKGIMMNTTIVYNKYTSEATDSGFVNYQGLNYYASQVVRLKKFNLLGGYAYTKNNFLKYFTLEGMGDFSLNTWFNVGINLKYNRQMTGEEYWGKGVQLRIGMRNCGNIQLQYEKSFLPTMTRHLSPVDIGRVTYSRRF